MSHFENYKKSLEQKYGLTRLQTDTEMRYGEPANQQDSRWHTERVKFLRAKYLPNAGRLEFEGYSAPPVKGTSVAELERRRGIEETRGERLFAIAGEDHTGQPTRFWVAVKF